jgi:hypothetical protein
VAHLGTRPRNTKGSTTLPEVLPPRVSRPITPRPATETTLPPLLRTGALHWDRPNYLHSAQGEEIVSRDHPDTAGPGNHPAGAHGESRARADIRSDKIRADGAAHTLPLDLPAIAGLLLGFLALAWSITRESTAPAFLIVLFSPGLKIAEFIMPAAHESLAWTFGWFLRIAIGVNAVVYFSILALAAYFLDRRARGA